MKKLIISLIFSFLFSSCAGEIYTVKGKKLILQPMYFETVCKDKVAKVFLSLKSDPRCLKAEIVGGPWRGADKKIWHVQARGLFEEKGVKMWRWAREENNQVVTSVRDNFKPLLHFDNLAEFDFFLVNPSVYYMTAKQIDREKKDQLLAKLVKKEIIETKSQKNKKKIEIIKENTEKEKNNFKEFEITSLINNLEIERKLTIKGKIEELRQSIRKASSIEKEKTEKQRTYQVQKGDSLWKISKNLVKHNGQNIEEINDVISLIAQENSIDNPDLIMTGQILKIPLIA